MDLTGWVHLSDLGHRLLERIVLSLYKFGVLNRLLVIARKFPPQVTRFHPNGLPESLSF